RYFIKVDILIHDFIVALCTMLNLYGVKRGLACFLRIPFDNQHSRFMMKRCLYLVFFFSSRRRHTRFGQKLSLNPIRTDFKIGHEDETICMKHLKTLEEHALSPVERGYEAAYHMFMANHTGNP